MEGIRKLFKTVIESDQNSFDKAVECYLNSGWSILRSGYTGSYFEAYLTSNHEVTIRTVTIGIPIIEKEEVPDTNWWGKRTTKIKRSYTGNTEEIKTTTCTTLSEFQREMREEYGMFYIDYGTAIGISVYIGSEVPKFEDE